MTSRHSHIASLLSPTQLEDFQKVKSALDNDPMILEHHKDHPKDKIRGKQYITIIVDEMGDTDA